MNKKTTDLKEFIKSKEILINDKFLVKVSMMDTGAFKKTYLIVTKSLLPEGGLKVQFFNDEEKAAEFLSMLHVL